MKTKSVLIGIILTFVFLSSKAQDEFEILIFDSSIQTAPVYNIGEIKNGSQEMLTYKIVNKRKTDVEIKNVRAPQGYMASISSNTIEAKDEVTIQIMFDTQFIQKKGEFDEKIIIKTDLIQDIEIEIKGVYLQ